MPEDDTKVPFMVKNSSGCALGFDPCNSACLNLTSEAPFVHWLR